MLIIVCGAVVQDVQSMIWGENEREEGNGQISERGKMSIREVLYAPSHQIA